MDEGERRKCQQHNDDSEADLPMLSLEIDEEAHKKQKCPYHRLSVVACVFVGVATVMLCITIGVVIKAAEKGKVQLHDKKNITSNIIPTLRTLDVTSSRPSVAASSPTYSPTLSTINVLLTSSTSPPVPTAITSVISPTAVVTTEMPVSSTVAVCGTSEFQCRDGSCIPSMFRCDGAQHCKDASDEQFDCLCNLDQYRCSSGQCIPASSRCDGVVQCNDRSDEMNCADCRGFECNSGLCLWTFMARCNQIVDCPDLSDEKKCRFRPGVHFRCKNGVFVLTSQRCDGVDNCHDNSDESKCGCDAGELKCEQGSRCVQKDWVCDGHFDCPNGTDERNCGVCSDDEFWCGDHDCLASTKVCDGHGDCSDNRDEKNCYKLAGKDSTAGQLEILCMGDSLPMCGDVWTEDLSDGVCKAMGYRSSIGMTLNSKLTDAPIFVHLNVNTTVHDELFLSSLYHSSSCKTGLVNLTCEPYDCGVRKDQVTPFIVGGNIAPQGRWPWVGSLSYLGEEICGLAIVSDEWVLTAGHCVIGPGTSKRMNLPFYFEVLVGSSLRIRSVKNSPAQRIRVDRIIVHPNMKRTVTGEFIWDAAMLHLEQRILFSEDIQPICLPESSSLSPPLANCYLAGWGYINPAKSVTVQKLREARLLVWSDMECRKDTEDMKVTEDVLLCAGYSSGEIGGCQGDSGSPLMCETTRGRWVLTGIMSSGSLGCEGIGGSTKSDRFTKSVSLVDWINQMMDGRVL
ncbi:hypothetical protein ScPMuIL_010725 [Solemya velum]